MQRLDKLVTIQLGLAVRSKNSFDEAGPVRVLMTRDPLGDRLILFRWRVDGETALD